MQKICTQCRSPFGVAPEDLGFHERISPTYAGTRFDIPPPSLCPDCRFRRRISWRNEYHYYSRKCSSCEKPVVSVHAEDRSFPVFCNRCWWGDGWDPLEYGLPYDPNRSFFEQFTELAGRVPQLAMMNDNGVSSENCEYTNDFAFGKNCYLVTGSWQVQDSFYSSCCNHVRDVCDCECVNLGSELVYESIDSTQLYHCTFLQSSSGCHHCHFGIDLKGCSDCVGCIGLRQAKFHILNEPFAEEEYRQRVASLDLSSAAGQSRFAAHFQRHAAAFPRKPRQFVGCEDCAGDNLTNCRNVFGFDTFDGEHSKYFVKGDAPKHCQDIQNSGNPQWCYESITPDNSYLVSFSLWCWKCKNVLYSDNCHSSDDLFGCIALKRHRHCILNRQYAPSEYEALVSRIIANMRRDGEWGEFFPSALSPFAYEDSLAGDLFPLSKEELHRRGWRSKERPKKAGLPATAPLPDRIADAPEMITRELFACTDCEKNYRILPAELLFYQKMSLPPPHRCPECRRRRRQAIRVPYSFRPHLRRCEECGRAVETAYPETLAPKIFCESCYSASVY